MRGFVAELPLDYGGPVGERFEPFPETALGGSIVDRFRDIVRRFPERLAVRDQSTSLSYSELAKLAGRIGAAAASVAEGRPGPIAIILPNDVRYQAAFLGILAAGRGFVGLDIEHPLERNLRIAKLAKVAAVVSAGDAAEAIGRMSSSAIPVVDVERTREPSRALAYSRIAPDDLAFVLYTSGSTGNPKGAIHSPRSCLRGTMLSTHTLHLTLEDRIALHSSPAVAAGLRNSFLALLNGASLHILPPRALKPAGLVREIRERGITVLPAIPVLFRRLVEALGENERLESVRHVRLAGDRVTWSDFDAFRRGCPPSAFLSILLASSECFSNYFQWFVDGGVRAAGRELPVGRVTPGLTVALLDERGEPVAEGAVGEIVVASRHLADGYWNEPELTARTFFADPDDPAVRILHTGDLGRRRPDGLFEFVGRKDHQIKLRGHRIEPGEIESALCRIHGMRDAAVVVRRDDAGVTRSLVAYCELDAGGRGLFPRHLLWKLSRALPEFMVPADLFVVEALPRLPNMKVDRDRLAELDAVRETAAGDPRGHPVLIEVTGIIETVLGVSGATPEDNLSSLGGDSLQAVEIMAEVEARFGVSVPTDLFAARRNIRDLASWIAERAAT